MQFIKLFIFLLTCVFLFQCKNEINDVSIKESNANSIDLSAYKIEDIPGTDLQMVTKELPNSLVEEQGMIKDGQKTGTWVKFFPKNGKIMEVWNYQDGKLNGIHLVLNNSGRVDMYETYLDNQLHGKKMTFKMGTPVEEMSYKNGKLTGKFRGFSSGGKLIREGEYENGLQIGQYIQRDEKGDIVLTCFYDKGVKINCY